MATYSTSDLPSSRRGQQHRISASLYDKAQNKLFLDAESYAKSHVLGLKKNCSAVDQASDRTGATDGTGSTTLVIASATGHTTDTGQEGQELQDLKPVQASAEQEPWETLRSTEELETYRSEHRKFEAFIVEKEQHSYSRLSLTRDLFEQLCSQVGVFQAFREMVVYLGQRTCEVEVAPPRPRYCSLEGELKDGWQLTYGLRYMETNNGTSGKPWSLRQSMFYNRTDVTNGRSSWIFVAPTSTLREDLKQIFQREDERGQDLASHLAFLESSIVCWRPYLVYLTEQVGEHVSTRNLLTPSTNVLRFVKLSLEIPKMQTS